MPPSLASRLLFHATPPPVLLDDADINAELYDIIALALRAYVSPWWSKLTRYDRDLLPHISTILAHVIRVLHERVEAQDLGLLVFQDVPVIITQHYIDYRNAASKMNTAYATGGAAALPALFAHLQPHMAISSTGVLDREYYRHITDRVLALCLPDDDYAPDPERIIIREVILKLLLDDILPKVTQPWFIQSTVLDLLPERPAQTPPPATTLSFHTLLILALSTLQAFSGFCLALINAYKHALRLISHSPPPAPSATAAQEPTAATPSLYSSSSIHSSIAPDPPPPPSYAHQPLLLFATLLTAPTRLAPTAIFHALHILAALLAPTLDRLLPALLAAFLSPARVLALLRAAKRTLFPNGYPGPPPLDPTPDEQAALRARLAAALHPPVLAPLLLGPDPDRTLDGVLDPLSDAQCNMRLAVFLLDRVLLGVFPELAGS